MEADPFPIGAVLKDPKRFVVPIYQRTYAWKIDPHLWPFFEQVESKAEERLKGLDIFAHYMGAVLIIPRGKYAFGKLNVFDVVDGQQRLTTFQLFLSALRDLAREYEFQAEADLLASFLLNADGPQVHERAERFKLYPTSYDRALFCDLVELDGAGLRKKYPDHFYKNGKVMERAPLALRAWGFLREAAKAFVDGAENHLERLTALSAALLENFQIIVITLDERDDAQVIFETLNAGGAPLAAMDLVRNDVFHRAARSKEDVETLMENRWKVFDDIFWKEDSVRGRIRKPRMDFFLSDTLAAETGQEILLMELYAQYKKFVKARSFESVDAELETLLKYIPTYRALANPQGEGPLARLARSLNIFDVTTAYPLIFVIEASDATDEDKRVLYGLVESYIVRRMLCGLPAKAYNNTFLRIAAELRAGGVTVPAARAVFASLKGNTVEFPNDTVFADAIATRRQYGMVRQARLVHILSEIELAARDKYDEATALPLGLTIEHVLPDVWAEHWALGDGTIVPADLRTGMSEIQLKTIQEREDLKHTLGNLTLLNDARNPSLSNLGFATKRAALAKSLLKLNQNLADLPAWDESRIRERAKWMSSLALQIWPPS